MAISATEVAKLRKMTGAGMMDCKKALEEANGDYEKAVDIIRKKGQLVASKRADRDADEGCALAGVSTDGTTGAVVVLNCETDFVAKNEDFIKFTQGILQAALDHKPADIEALKKLSVNGVTIADGINDRLAAIGEKIDISYFGMIQAAQVVPYIHPGNKLATLIGFNRKLVDIQVGKDLAMQIAAMNPVAVDKSSVSEKTIQKEKEIALDQTKNDPKNVGKPENILTKIAEGKLEKFFKENTLLNQEFIKDNKHTVGQYVESIDKGLVPTEFIRQQLGA